MVRVYQKKVETKSLIISQKIVGLSAAQYKLSFEDKEAFLQLKEEFLKDKF